MRTRRLSWHLLALGLPILGLLIWGAHSQSHGGVFHPLSAAGYSVHSKTVVTVLQTSADFLTFLGGTLLWPVMLLPVAFRLPMPYRIGFALLAIVGCIVGAYQPDAASKVLYALMFMAGGMLLLVSVVSLIAKPDADSLLLGLWFWGTVVFCVFFNWTVNARIIVPAMFPATLLAIRWLETLERPQFWIRWARVAIVPTLGISVMVAIGDYTLASASKTFTQTVVRDLKNGGSRIFFCGHWGFQHYMELEGAEPLNHRNTYWIPGDLFVFPKNNTNVQPPQLPLEKLLVKPFANPYGFHTMGADVNAGFYSSDWGSLPFQFNTTLPVDRFIVARYTPQKPQEPTSGDWDEPGPDSDE